MSHVCASCIGENDLKAWIRSNSSQSGSCDFCGAKRRRIVHIRELAAYMRRCLEKSWGYAVEQLPYDSREGGYQGRTQDTYDILFDELWLELPNDKSRSLAYALCSAIGFQHWCDYDWLRLDDDEALRLSWEQFSHIVKHERRFFFHLIRQSEDERAGSQVLDPTDILERIYQEVVANNLIFTLKAGSLLFRARPFDGTTCYGSVAELGPPPREFALQANRMNPPGIPMMYAAESLEAAVAEVRRKNVSIGHFRLTRDVNVIDLTNIAIPSIFSDATRMERLSWKFLAYFVKDITSPVERDKQVHLDYLPTQVVTEFFRTKQHDENPIMGIRYPSSLNASYRNVVLFITQGDLLEKPGESKPVLVLDQVTEYSLP